MRLSWVKPTQRLVLLAVLGSAPAAHADTALLTSADADRLTKLEAAAKAEGTVTLYTSLSAPTTVAVVDAFEKRYGIKLSVWRASADTVLQRVIQEQRAGLNKVDAVHVSAPELEALRREKLLQPLASPAFDGMIEGTAPSHHEWAGTHLAVWVQAYNTDQVKKEDLPKNYRDLLDPKWKNKLGYEYEDIAWFTTISKALGGDSGVQFFRDLVSRNGLSVRRGHSLLNSLVVSGEVALGLTVYNYMPVAAQKQGAPIDWFVLEPMVGLAQGVAVMKAAPHPHAAALFEEFLLSTAGQELFQNLNYIPAAKDRETPLKGVKMIVSDPAEKFDEGDKWEQLYQQIVQKRVEQ
jgi:iron(III) transport system substrate-binding protein